MTTSSPRIVVAGADGSGPSKDALQWAAEYARLASAELQAVTARRPPMTFGYAPDYSEVDFEAEARKTLEQAVSETLGADPPVTVTTQVAEGHSAPILIQAARKASLLVVGSRGHGAFAGMLLGSTSQHCDNTCGGHPALCTVTAASQLYPA